MCAFLFFCASLEVLIHIYQILQNLKVEFLEDRNLKLSCVWDCWRCLPVTYIFIFVNMKTKLQNMNNGYPFFCKIMTKEQQAVNYEGIQFVVTVLSLMQFQIENNKTGFPAKITFIGINITLNKLILCLRQMDA